MLNIDPYWGVFLVGTVVPALVALVTRKVASAAVKSVTLAALSAVGGVLTSVVVDGAQLSFKTAISNVFVVFITGVVIHYGLLKPTGVTGSNGVIARKVEGGIG